MTDAIAVRAQTRLFGQKSANCHVHHVNFIIKNLLTCTDGLYVRDRESAGAGNKKYANK